MTSNDGQKIKSSRKVKVGLIGFGLSGRVFHANLLRESDKFEIVAVASSREQEVRETLPGARVFASAQDLIADSEVEIVINAAPNPQHFFLSREALLSGKHVVVEKPFATTSQEARELIALAEKQNRFVTVYQNRRWDGDFLTVRKLIETRALGDLHLVESNFDRFRPTVRSDRWRERAEPGSGILFDLGAHLLDQALLLFGEPQTLWADVITQKPGAQADDYFQIVLGYNTCRVVLRSSSFAAIETPRFRVFGSGGSYVKFGLDPQEGQLREGMSVRNQNFAREPEAVFGEFKQSETSEPKRVQTERGCYLDFYDRLARAIELNRAELLPVDPCEALRVIELIEMAIQSSASGRKLQL